MDQELKNQNQAPIKNENTEISLREMTDINQYIQLKENSVKIAKLKAEASSIKRQERLNALNDYLGFAVTKLGGLGMLIMGILEYLQPDLLPVVISNPIQIAGAGFALLVGRNVIDLLATVNDALEKQKKS